MNANYPNIPSIYAIEQIINKKKLTDAVSTSHPLLATLLEKKALGNMLDYTVVNSPVGLKAVLPIMGSTGDASGVTKSGQYSALSLTEASSADVNFAEYQFAKSRQNFALDHMEKAQLENGEQIGLDIVGHRIQRMKAGFYKLFKDQLYGSSVGSEHALMGVNYALSTSNSPGNISQSTYSFWQSNVNQSTSGAITIDKVREGIQAARRHTVHEGIEGVDLILMSEVAASKLYSKFAGLVGANQRFMDTGIAKFGFKGLEFDGAIVLPDSALASGTVVYLNTASWMYGGNDAPELIGEPMRKIGTSVWEYYYVWNHTYGTNSPARNAIQTLLS